MIELSILAHTLDLLILNARKSAHAIPADELHNELQVGGLAASP